MRYTRVTRREVPLMWTRREEFRLTSGNLVGSKGAPDIYLVKSRGQLNDYWYEIFKIDHDDIVFTVMSYETPIAWVLANGHEVHVTQWFSRTTTCHQNRLYTQEESVWSRA